MYTSFMLINNERQTRNYTGCIVKCDRSWPSDLLGMVQSNCL